MSYNEGDVVLLTSEFCERFRIKDIPRLISIIRDQEMTPITISEGVDTLKPYHSINETDIDDNKTRDYKIKKLLEND